MKKIIILLFLVFCFAINCSERAKNLYIQSTFADSEIYKNDNGVYCVKVEYKDEDEFVKLDFPLGLFLSDDDKLSVNNKKIVKYEDHIFSCDSLFYDILQKLWTNTRTIFPQTVVSIEKILLKIS